jgi:hypothetical protein
VLGFEGRVAVEVGPPAGHFETMWCVLRPKVDLNWTRTSWSDSENENENGSAYVSV